MKIHKCGWCGEETKPIYRLKDGRFLCVVCAEKHYNYVVNKMEQHIQEVKNGLNKKSKKLTELKQAMCKHENAFDTDYVTGFGENMKYIWKCPDCGKTIYISVKSPRNCFFIAFFKVGKC